jgi:hypothetical protein
MDELTRMLALGYGAPALLGLLASAALVLFPRRADVTAGAGSGVLASSLIVTLLAAAALLAMLGIAGPVTVASWLQSDYRLRVAALLLPVAGLLGLGLVVVAGGRGAPVLGAMLAAAGAVIVGWPVLGPGGSTPPTERGLTLGVAALAGGVFTWTLGRFAGSGHRVSAAVILAGLGLATGAALLGTGASKTGQMGIALGVFLVPLSVGAFVRPTAIVSPVVVGVVGGVLVALLTSGYLYAKTPATLAAGILIGPPVVALLVGLCLAPLAAVRTRPWIVGLAQVLSAAGSAGNAVAPGLIELRQVESGGYEY